MTGPGRRWAMVSGHPVRKGGPTMRPPARPPVVVRAIFFRRTFRDRSRVAVTARGILPRVFICGRH